MATDVTDTELVARTLQGKQECYAELVRRHQSQLFQYARSMGLDPDTAEDMVQDTLVKAYMSLADCRDRARFGLWVGRILRNHCLDHFKSARHRRSVALQPDLPNAADDPERQRRVGALQEAIEASLQSLPLEQRDAFTLKHVEGRSYEEMAELADVSVSAMKMRVHRAREALRQSLDPADVQA